MQDKKKRVTWSDSSIENISEEDTTLSKKRQKISSFVATQAYQDFKRGIDQDLECSSIKLLITKLDYIRNQQKLPSWMKDICFCMFNWALEHKNVSLLTYLVQHLSERAAFVLISHNNYDKLKQFTATHLEQWNLEIEIENDVMTILKVLLTIQPNWSAQETIETLLTKSACPPPVVKVINEYLFPKEKKLDSEAPSSPSDVTIIQKALQDIPNIPIFDVQRKRSLPNQEPSIPESKNNVSTVSYSS